MTRIRIHVPDAERRRANGSVRAPGIGVGAQASLHGTVGEVLRHLGTSVLYRHDGASPHSHEFIPARWVIEIT